MSDVYDFHEEIKDLKQKYEGIEKKIIEDVVNAMNDELKHLVLRYQNLIPSLLGIDPGLISNLVKEIERQKKEFQERSLIL